MSRMQKPETPHFVAEATSQCNVTFCGPPDDPSVHPVAAIRQTDLDGRTWVSVPLKITEEGMKQLAETGFIYVHFMAATFPPFAVRCAEPVDPDAEN